jgi:putative ABC transport system permease protein
MAFIRGQDLGADIDQTLVVKVPPSENSDQQSLLARSQLSDLTSITGAAVSTSVPGQGYSNSISGIARQNASEDESHSCCIIDVDDRYFQFFDIPVLAGQTFSQGFLSDHTNLVLNEEAVKILGFESIEGVINRNITIWGDTFQVIGVVKNYHHQSLHDKIEPVIFWPLPYALFSGTNYLSLKISGTSIRQVISDVNKKWKSIFPGLPFEYSFLDEEFNQQYISDKRFSSIFGLSSLLAVFISCLGLFGLASFSAERRTHEIGIRKVFGANIPEITRMLIKEFIRFVIIANLIAWPIAWIIMNKWLERFAYRTSVDLWTMGLAGLSAFIIAVATVSYKAVKAAAANPVESIKYE